MALKEENQRGRKSEGKSKRHGARNQNRHKHFVKWLMETFNPEEFCPSSNKVTNPSCLEGCDVKERYQKNKIENERETMNSKDKNTNVINTTNQQWHILDVAGGKGEVSARLVMCHRHHVIMIDPRPANIVDCFERVVLPKIPNKWQRRLEDQRSTDPDFIKNIVQSRFQQVITTFDEDKFDNNKTDEISLELRRAVENSTLILGLHADGATEAIVDVALKFNKPFVVVPCCVFPNFFKSRTILVECTDDNDKDDDNGKNKNNNNNNGTAHKMKSIPVRTHDQFCLYLLRKDPRFVMEQLPFEGRNIAIWWDGK